MTWADEHRVTVENVSPEFNHFRASGTFDGIGGVSVAVDSVWPAATWGYPTTAEGAVWLLRDTVAKRQRRQDDATRWTFGVEGS
jgi:hypothetical protein